MERVGIPPADRDAIFRTVAAILNLGNISFAPGPEDSSSVDGPTQQYLTATGVPACLPASAACAVQTEGDRQRAEGRGGRRKSACALRGQRRCRAASARFTDLPSRGLALSQVMWLDVAGTTHQLCRFALHAPPPPAPPCRS